MHHFWVICLLVGSVLAQVTLIRNGMIDVEPDFRPFNYNEGGRDWPSSCLTGRFQTPIDISDSYSNLQIITAANSTFREFRISTSPQPRSDLYVLDVNGENSNWLSGTTMAQEILGRISRLTMLEAHSVTPAEHTYNGLRYPMELQMVFSLSQPDGNIVAGLNIITLYREGRADPFLEDLINPNHTTIDISPEFPQGGVVDDYYYYVGSVELPWPDCWEPFVWFMPNYILEASPEQIQYFSDPVVRNFGFSNGRGNVRSLQPLNDRPVYHYITP